MGKPVILIGYDVEAFWDPRITRRFLKVCTRIHKETGTPCTIFVTGVTLEKNIKEFRELAGEPGGLFDIQQHTYSHILLKTVCCNDGRRTRVWEGAPPGDIEREVKKTSGLIRKHLGIKCTGLTGPYCYYRGLSDRPDILRILHAAGIRFTRTYGRDANDWFPVPFTVQPFWYKPQGFGDILEIPIQGWQDNDIRERYGWHNTAGYIKHLFKCVDYIRKNGLVWGYLQHDKSSIKGDGEMSIIKNLVKYAGAKGVQFMSYKQFYSLQLKRRR